MGLFRLSEEEMWEGLSFHGEKMWDEHAKGRHRAEMGPQVLCFECMAAFPRDRGKSLWWILGVPDDFDKVGAEASSILAGAYLSGNVGLTKKSLRSLNLMHHLRTSEERRFWTAIDIARPEESILVKHDVNSVYKRMEELRQADREAWANRVV